MNLKNLEEQTKNKTVMLALVKVGESQKKTIALQNEASLIRQAVHSPYPVCGGVAQEGIFEKFDYSPKIIKSHEGTIS